MNEPNSSPRKHDRDDEKKRQEQSRRQLHFAISYLITSLIVLWLFQVFVLTPLTRKHRNSLQRVQEKTGWRSNRRGNHRRKGHRWGDEKSQTGRNSSGRPIQYRTCAWPATPS